MSSEEAREPRPGRGARGRPCGGPRGARPGGRLVRAAPRPACSSLAVPEAHGGEGLGLARGRRAAPRDRRPGRAPAGVGDALLRGAHPGRGRQRRAAGAAAARHRHRRRRSSRPRVREVGAGIPDATRRRRSRTAGSPAARSASRTPTAPPRCSCRRWTATTSWSPWSTRPPTASPCTPSPSSSGRRRAHGRPRRRPGRACCPVTGPHGCCASSPWPGSASPRPGVVAGARDLTADVRQGAHAVRPHARGVPGGGAADRRRLRRLPHDHPGRRQRRLAGVRGPRRRRRPRRGGVLAVRRGPGRAAHLPAPARRDGRRRDLPAAPLLLVGHRHHPRARRAAAHPGRGPGRGPGRQEPRAHRGPAPAQGRAARLLHRPRRATTSTAT